MLRLTDKHRELIRKHFPKENYPDDRPGRKPVPVRTSLDAVLCILNTDAQWHMPPQSYPNHKTVHRRAQRWCENEVLRASLTDAANSLREQGTEAIAPHRFTCVRKNIQDGRRWIVTRFFA